MYVEKQGFTKIEHSKVTTQMPPVNMGISLLLVVFLALCLFTFAAIALSSALNESKQAQDIVARKEAYYAACNEAEESLRDLSAQLESGASILSMEQTLHFTISDSQELQVTIAPAKDGHDYRVLGWQTVDTTVWESVDQITLIQ
ncbi:MAG: hypothetical protein K6G04_04785 [Lachnospiraceae bacterium]|nr:hypothetical protein [Lachnospiraceae bacterium]